MPSAGAWGNGLCRSSDTVIPHMLLFRAWQDVTWAQAAASAERLAVSVLPPAGVRPLRPGLACCQGDGLGGFGGSCVRGAGGWIIGEGDLAVAQVSDHILGTGLVPDVGAAAGAPSPLWCGRLGELQVQGAQVRQDPVLADVGVLKPARAARAGGGVAVAAPVGGLAVGPRRFHPPPAATAYQQSGQEVPAPPRRAALVRGQSRADPPPWRDCARGSCPRSPSAADRTRSSSTQRWPQQPSTPGPDRTCLMRSPGARSTTSGSTPCRWRSPISAPPPAGQAPRYARHASTWASTLSTRYRNDQFGTQWKRLSDGRAADHNGGTRDAVGVTEHDGGHRRAWRLPGRRCCLGGQLRRSSAAAGGCG